MRMENRSYAERMSALYPFPLWLTHPIPFKQTTSSLHPLHPSFKRLQLLFLATLRRAIMSRFWVLIGSFNPLISTLQFTESPPSLSLVSQFQSGTSPTWLANSHKCPTTIFATDETATGAINSLALDRSTGALTRLANVSTQGSAPTHLGFINDGATLGAANFVTGSALFVDLDATGTGQFTQSSALIPFEGSGPLPKQLSPHAHQVGIIFQSKSLRTQLTIALFFLDCAIRRRSARPRPWFRQGLAPRAGGQHMGSQGLH